MSSSKPTLGVFIGRFQPLHKAHQKIIEEGLSRCQNLLVLVGSANQPRTPRNPFSAQERIALIEKTFDHNPRLIVRALADSDYNLNDWVARVQRAASETLDHLGISGAIALVGHSKDASSYYLDLFPSWQSINIDQVQELAATAIREKVFGSVEMCHDLLEQIEQHEKKEGRDRGVSTQEYLDRYVLRARQSAQLFLAQQKADPNALMDAPTLEFLGNFIHSKAYQGVAEEFAFVAKYRYAWRHAPYPPTFVTADAVVVQSGHVLLTRRRAHPGRGLWALPGGFVDQKETIEQACLRELEEETGLRVPRAVLLGSLKDKKVFDDPHRSSRGRTITHAFLFVLRAGPLPKIKKVKFNEETQQGNDEESMGLAWVPIEKIDKLEMFEDHRPIIKNLTASL